MSPPDCFIIPCTVERPSPLPLPTSLGSKERLEDTRYGFGIDPVPRISHSHFNETALRNIQMRRDIVAVKNLVTSFDGQGAALRHGVTGIHHQVHNYLFELPGIRPYISEFGIENGSEIDAFHELFVLASARYS